MGAVSRSSEVLVGRLKHRKGIRIFRAGVCEAIHELRAFSNHAVSMLIPSFRHARRTHCLGHFIRWHHREAWRASWTNAALDARRPLQTQASAGDVPFRKQLKDEAKQRKDYAKGTGPTGNGIDEAKLAGWELTVGLEIHAQLNTERKLFSGKFLGVVMSWLLFKLTLSRCIGICQ